MKFNIVITRIGLPTDAPHLPGLSYTAKSMIVVAIGDPDVRGGIYFDVKCISADNYALPDGRLVKVGDQITLVS